MTVQIEPIPQALTANEKRVKELLGRGKTASQIACKLYMSFEAVREIIFDIRKKESIMAHRLTQEEKQEIRRLAAEGVTVKDIAGRFYTCQQTIRNVLKSEATAQAELPAEAAPPLEDKITETEEQQIAEMPGLPRCVWIALNDRITALNIDIQLREQHIEALKSEIDMLVVEREQIRAWMEAHE